MYEYIRVCSNAKGNGSQASSSSSLCSLLTNGSLPDGHVCCASGGGAISGVQLAPVAGQPAPTARALVGAGDACCGLTTYYSASELLLFSCTVPVAFRMNTYLANDDE